MKTIVLSGGHVSPAVAIAEELQKRGYRVVVFGRPYAFSEAPDKPSLEKEMFEEMGVDFRPVDIPRVPQSGWQFPRYGASFISSTLAIIKSLRELQPTAVMSFGGYVGIPLLAAASLLRIPIYLHEQTTAAGKNNIFFSHMAKKVFISWPETIQTFPKEVRDKIVLTGNPVRKEILSVKPSLPSKKNLTVYITGGSTGAHAINIVVAGCLEKLLNKFFIIHQAGDSQFNDFEMLTEKRNALPKDLQKKYQLVKYIKLSQVKKTYEDADIIVGRSGANTVAEVALLGKPSIFIPLPLAQYNEQELLAAKLSNERIAIAIRQKDFTEESLVSSLTAIAKNYDRYVKHAKLYRESQEITRHKTAHGNIVDHIELWRNQRRNSTS